MWNEIFLNGSKFYRNITKCYRLVQMNQRKTICYQMVNSINKRFLMVQNISIFLLYVSEMFRRRMKFCTKILSSCIWVPTLQIALGNDPKKIQSKNFQNMSKSNKLPGEDTLIPTECFSQHTRVLKTYVQKWHLWFASQKAQHSWKLVARW